MHNWIQKSYNSIKNKKVSKLLLAGSHDSGAYKLSKINCLIKTIISGWTITQQLSIFNQLTSGIRSIDLRITFTDEFYVSHTFMCEPLAYSLLQVSTFLEQNPFEIILIHIKPDYSNRHTMVNKETDLSNFLRESTIGRYISNADYNNITVEEIVNSGKRIFIFSDSYNYMKNYWFDQTEPNKLIELYNKIELIDEPINIGFVLTPNTKYILGHPFGSLKKMAIQMNSHLDEILNNRKNVNVISFDYIDNILVNKIIESNFVDKIKNTQEYKK